MKPLPFSSELEILQFAQAFETPFYLYDERKIVTQCQILKDAYSWANGFKNYFAVKATPIPQILKLIKTQGFGVDCSSYAELMLAEQVGFKQESIFFTSNNTTIREYKKAYELGAIINLDYASHLDLLYNPGCLSVGGNSILGNPAESKFGMTKEQLFRAYETARSLGSKSFSLHTMVLSNCLEPTEFLKIAEMMFDLVKEIKDRLGIFISHLNLGGGYGIPYKPFEIPLDTYSLGKNVQSLYHGMLSKGVDASITNLIRPAMYGAYHHITYLKEKKIEVLSCGTDGENLEASGTYDVVGSLCENNDKLATDRYIDLGVSIGDILVFHDTGAHCSAMGFHYNGKLQCAEYILGEFGEIRLIKRCENYTDLFATLVW